MGGQNFLFSASHNYVLPFWQINQNNLLSILEENLFKRKVMERPSSENPKTSHTINQRISSVGVTPNLS